MPTIVHFDIATDNPQRAKKFYESLFGWKMEGPPGMTDYYLIETEDLHGNKGVGGGLVREEIPLKESPLILASTTLMNTVIK